MRGCVLHPVAAVQADLDSSAMDKDVNTANASLYNSHSNKHANQDEVRNSRAAV